MGSFRSRNPLRLTEHDEQAAFIRAFREEHPAYWVLAIPNGGHRHKASALKLQAEGLSPGVPDLFIPALRLWIEMKREGGKVSTEQERWSRYLTQAGYHVLITYGARDALAKVEHFLQQKSEEL